jgi:iron complex outermembrane recepter protein
MTYPISCAATLLLFSNIVWAAEDHVRAAGEDLNHLKLEELMNVEVTSVSKRAEKLSEAPAAITLITAEELRRSGATSIPEALRQVPGMDVARLDAHDWAISARGFNDLFANKLLVLMDGRSVYTPLFSGVYWDVQDTLLEDIDRIEVIRGPGAALWGANAVNGVINIMTRPAEETQGLLLTGGGGSEERGFAGIRYGGSLGTNAYYRAYAKYFNRDDQVVPDGSDANDRWNMQRGGFRVDWKPSTEDQYTLQGDLYSGRAQQTFFLPTPNPPAFAETNRSSVDVTGGNVIGRWTRAFSDSADLKLQFYYDRTTRETAVLDEERNTIDVDLQHHFLWGERQDIVWGLGYRASAEKIDSSYTGAFDPDQRTVQLFSLFGQDEITVMADRLHLTLGSKFEHNDFTGFEYQPSGRLSWTPSDRQTIWGSVSRAVRTPSLAEDDIRLRQLTGLPGVQVLLQGDRAFDSEDLLAYEVGYRWRPLERVSLDLTAFYNEYDHLRSVEPGAVLAGPPVTLTATAGNKLHGETYGIEFAPKWQVTDWWRLQAAYTFLQMELHRDSGSGDTTSERAEGRSPHHQLSLRSSLDLPHDVEFDCTLRYIDRLVDFSIPSYVVLDLRLAWRPFKNLELAIVGQNLLDNRHPEFQALIITTERTEVEHSVYGKVTWRY